MSPEPNRINELFAASKADLLAIDPTTVERPRVTRDRALYLTATLRQELEPLLPLLPDVLAPAQVTARQADYQAIEPRVLVFYAADMVVAQPWTSEQKERRAELARKVRQHDEMLSAWAVPAFREDEEDSAEVADILRGRGMRDDAEDTVRLVALFRGRWAGVQGKTPITEAYLAEAEVDATALLGLILMSGEDATGSPRDLRRRAYTWWAKPYLELFHLGRYLLRNDPAAAERLPAIAAERTATRGAASAPAPAPVPAPALADAGATQSATSPAAPA